MSEGKLSQIRRQEITQKKKKKHAHTTTTVNQHKKGNDNQATQCALNVTTPVCPVVPFR